ncbi:tape measure protein [Lysinibacillus macroides]|uniref:Tape measure protein N-terminal domain-containing protein n=1 Tax=Lysinibacillus macroides TaxID=33935 RepID=A0A0M9DJ69_9BACI|nr:tape measure protein [Lysinibacillus macroides]KOY81272.1 hypothetical protein ADM90_19235 [Lysinibacillus macroides]QPR68568.1 tape measure protein [Lysinibacillus macroides]
MATIRTAINMTDNLSPIFRSINSALQLTISGFENLQNASGEVVDISRLQQAQRELARVDEMFNRIESEIRDAENEQERFNNRIRDGTSAMDGLIGKVMTLIGAYLSLQGLGKVIQLSDEMTDLKARVQLLVDDMPVLPDQVSEVDFGLGDMSEIDLAQQMIHDAAQRSFSSYKDTANMVARIGTNARDAFGSMGEVVAFTELVQKQFGIAGANATEASNATLQLSQALASGVLRGDELNSIFEQAPNLIATIADYMGEPIGAIRELASDGAITAEIVKNAMFAATDEINAKFDSMPVTWGQMWIVFQNEALHAFGPVLQKINDIANSDRFKQFATSATQALYVVAGAVEQTLVMIINLGSLIYDNWSAIAPIVGAATTAVMGYVGALGAVVVAKMAVSAWAAITTTALWGYAMVTGLGTGTTWSMVAAAWGLNAALAANPVFLVVMGIVALITILYVAVGAINLFANKSISATGVVAGVFLALGATVANAFIYIWNIAVEVFTNIYNVSATVAEGLINIFSGDLSAIGRMFAQLGDNALSILQSIAKAMDFVLGTNMADSWGQWRENLQAWTDEKLGINKHKVERMVAEDWQLKTFDIVEAYGKGYDWGERVTDFSVPKANTGNTDALMKSINDALAMGDGISDKLDTGNDDGKKTAGNTKKAADGIKMLNEDLKYLRDIAEREAINRYTTAEINIDARSENHINNEMDIDGIIDRFAEKAEAAAEMLAEGGPTEHV